jgi:hypothetical protein
MFEKSFYSIFYNKGQLESQAHYEQGDQIGDLFSLVSFLKITELAKSVGHLPIVLR